MRIMLLSGGRYEGLEGVEFPVEVVGEEPSHYKGCVAVTTEELVRVGADRVCFDPYLDWLFDAHEFYVLEDSF